MINIIITRSITVTTSKLTDIVTGRFEEFVVTESEKTKEWKSLDVTHKCFIVLPRADNVILMLLVLSPTLVLADTDIT